MDSLSSRSTVLTAECVKGEVTASRDSFVTCPLSALAEAVRRGRASASFAASVAAVGGVVRAIWNWPIRVRVVLMMGDSCLDIVRVVGWPGLGWRGM